MPFPDYPVLLTVVLIANWPIYTRLMQFFFGDASGLAQALGYWALPDLLSLLMNRYWEDQWAEFRLTLWLILCAGVVVAEYRLAALLLDGWYAHVMCCKPAGP